MLRVGKEIIVSFPNMGHWSSRIQLLFNGMMPITTNLPYRWDNTPNIHLCTIKDFLKFCRDNNFEIFSNSNYPKTLIELGGYQANFGNIALLEFHNSIFFEDVPQWLGF